MMLLIRNHRIPKRKHLGALLLLLSVSIICLAFSIARSDDFDFARREVLLRRLGHEVLLQSGDSLSRVLPVKKVNENEYRISFEHGLTFQPEFLVNSTRRLLAKDPNTSDYVINVLNAANGEVVYGYAVSKDKKDDIISCLGRRQPIATYIIDVKLKPKGIATATNGYALGALLFSAFIGFILLRPGQPGKPMPDRQRGETFTLASILFDAETRKLIMNGQTTQLTKTETRVLRMFALSPNEVIDRSRLQKEIWEDEGVIVGRSLDMFISKLRKKLETDPHVKIVVIRGKGYRLDISA